MKPPDLASLDPPPRPGETIAWCPLCGSVINRRDPNDLRSPMRIALEEEERASDHMLAEHELTPDLAIATLMEAVKQ